MTAHIVSSLRRHLLVNTTPPSHLPVNSLQQVHTRSLFNSRHSQSMPAKSALPAYLRVRLILPCLLLPVVTDQLDNCWLCILQSVVKLTLIEPHGQLQCYTMKVRMLFLVDRVCWPYCCVINHRCSSWQRGPYHCQHWGSRTWSGQTERHQSFWSSCSSHCGTCNWGIHRQVCTSGTWTTFAQYQLCRTTNSWKSILCHCYAGLVAWLLQLYAGLCFLTHMYKHWSPSFSYVSVLAAAIYRHSWWDSKMPTTVW